MNTYTKWEYKVVRDYELDLNGLGGQGWELCAFNNHHFYVFKRPIVEQTRSKERIKEAIKILGSTKLAKEKLGINFKVGDWITRLGWKTAFLVSKIADGSIYFWSNGREMGYADWDGFSLAPKDMPKDKSSYNPAEKIKVGDWVFDKKGKWLNSYEVAKIQNNHVHFWIEGKISLTRYDIETLIVCDDFEKHPKHNGRPAKKVNPNNPQNIRKGNWVAIDKSGCQAYKVFSVKNGKLVIIYLGRHNTSLSDSLKTVYKVKAEDFKSGKKIKIF